MKAKSNHEMFVSCLLCHPLRHCNYGDVITQRGPAALETNDWLWILTVITAYIAGGNCNKEKLVRCLDHTHCQPATKLHCIILKQKTENDCFIKTTPAFSLSCVHVFHFDASDVFDRLLFFGVCTCFFLKKLAAHFQLHLGFLSHDVLLKQTVSSHSGIAAIVNASEIKRRVLWHV